VDTQITWQLEQELLKPRLMAPEGKGYAKLFDLIDVDSRGYLDAAGAKDFLRLVMGGEVIRMRPCIFHSWFSIRNKQGGMKMTLTATTILYQGAAAATWLPSGANVRTLPGRLSALSVFYIKSVLCGVLVGRAMRLTAQNGGFRAGQCWGGSTRTGR
jgi:hypothetical protein